VSIAIPATFMVALGEMFVQIAREEIEKAVERGTRLSELIDEARLTEIMDRVQMRAAQEIKDSVREGKLKNVKITKD